MKLLNFLDALESNNIYFRLNHIRNSILVEVAIPGERWEVEFLDDDTVEVERFVSDGEIRDEKNFRATVQRRSATLTIGRAEGRGGSEGAKALSVFA